MDDPTPSPRTPSKCRPLTGACVRAVRSGKFDWEEKFVFAAFERVWTQSWEGFVMQPSEAASEGRCAAAWQKAPMPPPARTQINLFFAVTGSFDPM